MQRAVIPVYARRPRSDEHRAKDYREVNQFARESSLSANSGEIVNDLASGGNLAGITAPERIILVGHGNVGSINGYSGAEVANMLKTQWHLPRDYTGSIRISSCKAGDMGWFSLSLVVAVSNNLMGYQCTVEGLKGNVITGRETNPNPGEDRSVASDAAFARYKQLQADYDRALTDRDSEMARRYNSEKSRRDGLRLAIGALELNRNKLLREQSEQSSISSMVSSIGSFLGAPSASAEKLKKLDADLLANHAEADRLDRYLAIVGPEIHATFQHRVAPILEEMNSIGILFGDRNITVRITPEDRKPLVDKFVEFVEREIEASRPRPVASPLSIV